MPINRDDKIAFIHIPKTAGTSIEEALGLINDNYRESFFSGQRWYPGTKVYPQHFTYQELRSRVLNLDDFFSFTFVRNPYDRLYSEWCYRKKMKGSLRKFLRHVCESLKRSSCSGSNHFRPQVDFVADSLDFVGKYEQLNTDFDRLTGLLPNGCRPSGLPFKMKNPYRHESCYLKYFDDESRRIAQQLYASDFECFGYKL